MNKPKVYVYYVAAMSLCLFGMFIADKGVEQSVYIVGIFIMAALSIGEMTETK